MNPPRPRSAESLAAAYRFADRVVVITYGHLPEEGLLVQGAVCFTVRLPAREEVLGYAVLQALESFLPNYVLPKDYADQRKKQLQAMGVRSERQLQRHALYCSFRRTPEGVAFQPTHNGGHKGEGKGYQPLAAAAFGVAEGSGTGLVGAGLLRAFALSTTVFG